jgi:hypothetical protein
MTALHGSVAICTGPAASPPASSGRDTKRALSVDPYTWASRQPPTANAALLERRRSSDDEAGKRLESVLSRVGRACKGGRRGNDAAAPKRFQGPHAPPSHAAGVRCFSLPTRRPGTGRRPGPQTLALRHTACASPSVPTCNFATVIRHRVRLLL